MAQESYVAKVVYLVPTTDLHGKAVWNVDLLDTKGNYPKRYYGLSKPRAEAIAQALRDEFLVPIEELTAEDLL